MEYYIKAEGISKSFIGTKALNGIDMNIPKGKITGLLGPNGAGKTTFIRILTRITAADEGTLMMDGHVMTDKDVYGIGYLPEERGLYKKMNVYDQVVFFAALKGIPKHEARQRLDHWFNKLNMNSWKGKKVEELSKGMAQKVQFVATVIHQPKLLILDEPFTGFDPVNADEIKREILELKAQGTTILFSTHRMENVEELCDQIVLIDKGNKVLEGSVKEIRNREKEHLFSVKVAGSYSPKNEGIKIVNEHTENNETEYTLKLADEITANQLLAEVLPQATIIHFEEKIPTVHEIFVKYVSQKK